MEKYRFVDIERTAARIKRCRREVLHISQKALAERLGVTQGCVGQWERAVCLPSLDQAIGLSDAFGLPVNGFIVHRREEQSDREENAASV